MRKFLWPLHSARVVTTGLSEFAKICFVAKKTSNIINDFGKIYISSPSIHQGLYQKILRSFSNFIPVSKIQNILNEEVLGQLVEETVNHQTLDASELELETFESIEGMNYPLDFNREFSIVFPLDDSIEKQLNDPRLQTLFERSRHRIRFFFQNQGKVLRSAKTHL